MRFIKLDTADPSSAAFCRVLHCDTNTQLVCAPAKETVTDVAAPLPSAGERMAHTRIRIARGQCALLTAGDTISAARAVPGDYRVEGEEDLSRARVYFVRTSPFSSKVFDTHTPIVYAAKDAASGVQQDIRLHCSFYFHYRIRNPKTFLRFLSEEKQNRIMHQAVDTQLHSVFSVCLPDVLAQLAAEGIPYTELCGQSERLTALMNEKLALAWEHSRGIELKQFVIAMTTPNKEDEAAFWEQCAHAKAADDVTSEAFSEDFEKLMQELGTVAGEAVNLFQSEMTSLFEGLADALDSALTEEDEEDFSLEELLSSGGSDVMGRWECPQLKQSITFTLLDAVIETGGQETWRGDWEERHDGDVVTVVCPTAPAFGCYAYFELHGDTLDAVLSDTGDEKQCIRFVKAEG